MLAGLFPFSVPDHEELQADGRTEKQHPVGMQNDSNLLAQILGPAALSRLAEVYGGTDYLVPGSVRTLTGQALVELVGVEAAERLIAWARSSRVYIPKMRTTVRQQRAAEVRELHRQGLTAQQISRTFRYEARYSERAVFKILSEGKKA